MYEFHGWFVLRASPRDVDDPGFGQVMDRITAHVNALHWGGERGNNLIASLRWMNGDPFLDVAGHKNHRGDVQRELNELLKVIAQEAPGSYGLLYWRDDEGDLPAGANNFHVTVMARGLLHERLDPFLSPSVPVTEDPWTPD